MTRSEKEIQKINIILSYEYSQKIPNLEYIYELENKLNELINESSKR